MTTATSYKYGSRDNYFEVSNTGNERGEINLVEPDPVTDFPSVDHEFEEEFFRPAELAKSEEVPDWSDLDVDVHMQHKMSDAIITRRARYTRFVVVTMAILSFICVVAFIYER